jgi:PleD family two-component response regulator
VEVDRRACRAFGSGDSGDVIDVRVRQKNVPDGKRHPCSTLEQLRHRVTGIDEDSLTNVLTSDDVPVLLKRAARANFHYHDVMVLAVVDDLMFTSKIKATAQQLGVDVTFARSSDAALAGMRTRSPALVIFDLNNPRTDPLGTVAVMKGDPALASIPTVGFVSHVQSDLIDAARLAGVDEVLARSAFTARLAEILSGG